MKTIVTTDSKEHEKADILFRIYPNQLFGTVTKENIGGFYCWEILTKEYGMSAHEGQYNSHHPQAAQDVLEKLIDEQLPLDNTIAISNELKDGYPHPDCHDKNWFDNAIKNILAGQRKYAGKPLRANLSHDRLIVRSFREDGFPEFKWRDGGLRTEDVLIDAPFMFEATWEVVYFSKDREGYIYLHYYDGRAYQYNEKSGYFMNGGFEFYASPSYWVFLPKIELVIPDYMNPASRYVIAERSE